MADELIPIADSEDKPKRRGLRGNKQEKKEKKAKAPKPKAQGESGAGPLAGIQQWLLDSYNGIYKIVVEPLLPKRRMMLLLVLSFLIGMIWAYVIFPVTFYDASPHQLSNQQRDQYVILVAGAYDAGLYDDANTVQLLSRVEDPAETVQRLAQNADPSRQISVALNNIVPLAQQAAGTSAPGQGSIISSLFEFIISIVAFIALCVVFAILWGLLIGGFVERFIARFRPKTEADLAAARERVAIRESRRLQEEMTKQIAENAAASNLGVPIMQRVSPYTKGRAYDDSFAIEDEDDAFLGECGATIAKTIGDNQELTAIEIWLFDKDDFVRTLTKVFASPHAYNDPVLRSELDNRVENPATDIVMIAQGAVLEIGTDNIMVQAKIADLKPGTDASLPPNSHFDAITLQMLGWKTSGLPTPAPVPVPTAAPAGGLPDLSSYEIGPPPQMPSSLSGSTQPSMPAPMPPAPAGGLPDLSSYEIGPPPQMPSSLSGSTQPSMPSGTSFGQPSMGNRPLTPPPSLPSFPPDDDDDDDDPFGGTGDFTPINR